MNPTWQDNEDGPKCDCGNPTVVKRAGTRAVLLCLFHTPEEGCFMRLPDEKPANWSEWTIQDVARVE